MLRLHMCTIGKWSERSPKIIPFVLDSSFSILLLKILSINVAVCCVIRVGFVMSGIYEDVKSCSVNRFA